MIKRLKTFWTHSIMRQLILSIVLVHAVLMTIFVVDLVSKQSGFLKEHSQNHALGLTQTIAVNSVSWVLAQDFIGMEEIILSQSQQSDLLYAMLISPEGKVLAHTKQENIGLFISDSLSISLLKRKKAPQFLVNNSMLIDVASPIFSNEKFIGWARIGMSQTKISAGIASITQNGIWYTFLAIVIGAIFAIIMGRGITSGLRHLVSVADEITYGNEEARISLDRNDELGKLGKNLNVMINSIIEQKNITKETQTALLKAKNNAEKANQAKSMFLANVSHELRTPLNGILGFTQIFMRDKLLNTKQQKGIGVIHSSAEHLLILVNDILDFTKMEEGKIKLRKTDFNLSDFLHTVIELPRIGAEKKVLKFKLSIKTILPEIILSDKVRLQQILLNLLSNAVKFTKEGSVQFSVSSNYKPNDKKTTLYFEIIDTGVGISLEMQEKVFDVFQQVGNPHRFVEGTGLGLTISKKLIKQFGGELKLESPFSLINKQTGLGSRFYFQIEVESLKLENKAKENIAENIKSSSKKLFNTEKNEVFFVTCPSKEEMEKILKMSQEGDISALNKHIETLETAENGKYLAFIKKIQNWAENFHFEDIENFILKGIEKISEEK